MASQTQVCIDNVKDNGSEKDFGIEANDLATLLMRFEEATSSDDLQIPRPVHKTKWSIMKAKSVGSSPAVTPPATPPPSVRLKTFTQTTPVPANGPGRPIRLTVVNPAQIKTSTPKQTVQLRQGVSSQHQKATPPARPKINIQLAKPGMTSPFRLVSVDNGRSLLAKPMVSLATSPSLLPKGSSSNTAVGSGRSLLVKKNTSSPVNSPFSSRSSTPTAAKDPKWEPTSSKPPVLKVPFPSSTLPAPAATKRSVNALRMPALDAASSLNQSAPAPRKFTIPKRKRVDNNNIVSSSSTVPSTLSSPVVTAASPLVSILRTSSLPSALEQKQKTVAVPSNVSTLSTITSLPASPATAASLKQLPLLRLASCPNSVPSPKASPDSSSIQATSLPCNSSKPVVQKDEHSYFWSGPVFSSKTMSTGGSSMWAGSSTQQTTDSTCIDPVSTQDSSAEVVVEECEVFVDANGNDLGSKTESCMKPGEEEVLGRVVCFEGNSANNVMARRGRKYRRQMGMGASPVREDKSDFYDKIPSHYTALSIPSKQIRKTVFESVSNNLGSQDHLALSNEVETMTKGAEEEDEGQYNKVPIHHRIFTNTTNDLDELSFDHEDNADKEAEAKPKRTRRISSTSRHSGRSASSHRSNRSGSRQSHRSSRSRSPADADHAAEGRQSRPLTRKRNSASNCSSSSCSSCSSSSYCSTCGASLSRSRSRSVSSKSRERSFSPPGRSRSRSRSRSPRRRRRRMSSRNSTPDRRRSRSWSPSHSPVRRRRRNSYRTSSRSRRHMLKERSSAERKVMEQRKQREEEKVKAMEERRVLYVGKIPDNYTKHQLRKRFDTFGEIKNVRLNFRVHGDNYGFVTFAYTCDAFAAKEKGNLCPGKPKFDLCFGGRRRFCPDKYADLDGNREIEEEYAPLPSAHSSGELDYAALLKQHVSAQRKRKR